MGDSELAGMVAPEAPIIEAPLEERRGRAISQVLAAIAERQDEPVARFRREHLDGKVLAPTEIAAWVRRTGAEDGNASQYLMNVPGEAFKMQDDGSLVLPEEWVRGLRSRVPIFATRAGGYDISTWGPSEDAPHWEIKTLWYVTPESGNELASEAIRAGGTLDELRRLAFYLLNGHPYWQDIPQLPVEVRRMWGEARAAVFVLSGYAPLISETLFPLPVQRGMHRQSEKHLQLAVFTERRPGAPIAARLEEWNQRFSEWAYLRSTNFSWDSKQAVKRLLHYVGEEG